MAGIGFELRKLLKRDSYFSLIQAYTYAGIIGAGPWVLSILGVQAIGFMSLAVVVPDFLITQFQVSVTHLTADSLILTGFLQLAFTRYISDRLFEKRDDRVLPNFVGALQLTMLISGAVGLVVTMVFIALSAPDLALTQITVDVVTTVLLLMSLSLLPQLTPYESTQTQRWRDAIIAIVAGLGIGWITWLMLTRDHDSISWFFVQQSLPLGGGSNIVNVILVDFRGFDTFGEISVLGIAAIGTLSLMDGMRTHGTTITQGLTYRFNPSPLLVRTTASWVLPVALVVSLYIFMRGHNYPGGGFIAGLITAMALIIQYIALGQDYAEQLIKAKSGRLYEIWIGTGLSIAGVTGVLAWLWSRPFLTSAHVYLNVPILGKLHFPSAALFDLGVYFTVVGATMLMISVLGDSRHTNISGPVAKE